MAAMTDIAPTLAEEFARMHHAAKAECADARARLALVQAALLALLATLLGQLARIARRAPQGGVRRLRHSPYAVPHNTPGPRTARHWGPIPPRACRLGRLRIWWARNRGARAIPRHAPEFRPAKPARAPPAPGPCPQHPHPSPKHTPAGVRSRTPSAQPPPGPGI